MHCKFSCAAHPTVSVVFGTLFRHLALQGARSIDSRVRILGRGRTYRLTGSEVDTLRLLAFVIEQPIVLSIPSGQLPTSADNAAATFTYLAWYVREGHTYSR